MSRCVVCTVKGDVEVARAEADRFGIGTSIYTPLHGSLTFGPLTEVRVPVEDRFRVLDWFLDGSTQDRAPFKMGTLLWYREVFDSDPAPVVG